MASTYESKQSWTSWRKANYSFFEEHLGNFSKQKILVDLGSGPEQFRDITWQFNHKSVDFKQFGTTKIIADLTKPLPLENESVDIVFASNLLEHLPWGLDLLREAYRILKPGGMMIGTVPFLAQIHQEPYDYNRYTHFMLELMLKEAGFESREVKALGKPVKVYLNMQDQFFSHLKKTHFSDHKFLQFTLVRLGRFARLLSRILLAIFYPLFIRAPESPHFTQGYGFIGVKK